MVQFGLCQFELVIHPSDIVFLQKQERISTLHLFRVWVRFSSTLKPARKKIKFFAKLLSQEPPPLLNGKLCQWSSFGSLWARLCRSADWQVRRRVTVKAAILAANGIEGGWGMIVKPFPRQPPLNERVHGMRPDCSYITGWREGGGSGGER